MSDVRSLWMWMMLFVFVLFVYMFMFVVSYVHWRISICEFCQPIEFYSLFQSMFMRLGFFFFVFLLV